MTEKVVIQDPLVDTEEVLAEALWRLSDKQFMSAGYLVLTPIDKEHFRYRARQLMKRDAVLVPINTAFKLGDRVQKKVGYRYPGVVVCVLEKLDGAVRYVVECIAPGAEGMLHIFSEKDLEIVKE